jgi:Zn-dependent protease
MSDGDRVTPTILGRGLRLGKLFEFEIRLDFSLIVVFGLVLANLALGVLPAWHPNWTPGLRWAVAGCAAVSFFGSILLHELSHALVARALGTPVSGITLFMFGGVAHLEREPARASAELWIAIVGPLTSFAIGVLATLLGGWLAADTSSLTEDPVAVMRSVGPLATLLLWLGPLNVMLALFNLLPGFPLDGGHVLRALLWWKTGDLRKSTRWAALSGLVLSWLMMFAGISMAFGLNVPLLGSGLGSGLWLLMIGWFLSNAARSSYESLLARQALEHVAVGEVMWTHPEVVHRNDSIAHFVREKVLHTEQRVFPVVDGDQLLGAVNVKRLRDVPEAAWDSTTVEQVMTSPAELELASPRTEATQALQLLSTSDTQEIPVVDGLQLKGLLRRQDLLRWLSLHVKPVREGL